MEHKDHSHNRLDEGIIGSIGRVARAAGKTVGSGAMAAKRKIGSGARAVDKMSGGLGSSIIRGAKQELSPDNLAKKAVQKMGGKEQATGRMDQGPSAKGYLGIPKKMMQALPTDDKGRFNVAKTAAKTVSRAIGGKSPGLMGGVFDNDPFSAGPRDTEAYSDQRDMRRQARELMQLDPSLTYGQALTAVMQRLSQKTPAEAPPTTSGSATIGGAGSHAPRSDDHRDP
jgi:hypothetical protein